MAKVDAPNRIRELLDACGMSQAELARLSGVCPTALNKIVKGTRGLDQHWMELLAPNLGVSPAELLPLGDGRVMILSADERALILRFRSRRRARRTVLPDTGPDTGGTRRPGGPSHAN